MSENVIQLDDPAGTDVRQLLEVHLALMNLHTPPEDVHALDVNGLLDPAISFFSCRVDGELLAVGALKELSAVHGELKSMHTADRARGRGVGSAMVEHLLGLARDRGYERVSLETGTMDAFAAARTLYARFGFEPCPPYADYVESPNSLCMSLLLATTPDC